MKKRLVALILFAALLLPVAACMGEKDASLQAALENHLKEARDADASGEAGTPSEEGLSSEAGEGELYVSPAEEYGFSVLLKDPNWEAEDVDGGIQFSNSSLFPGGALVQIVVTDVGIRPTQSMLDVFLASLVSGMEEDLEMELTLADSGKCLAGADGTLAMWEERTANLGDFVLEMRFVVWPQGHRIVFVDAMSAPEEHEALLDDLQGILDSFRIVE